MTDAHQTRRAALARLAAAAGAFGAGGGARGQSEGDIRQAAFDLEELARRNGETPGPWLPFFDNGAFQAGHYALAAGAEDRQPVHATDEFYVVTKGAATLIAGEETFAAKPGAVFFVAAGVAHRFVDVAEDLEVLVFFSKADPSKG